MRTCLSISSSYAGGAIAVVELRASGLRGLKLTILALNIKNAQLGRPPKTKISLKQQRE